MGLNSTGLGRSRVCRDGRVGRMNWGSEEFSAAMVLLEPLEERYNYTRDVLSSEISRISFPPGCVRACPIICKRKGIR